MTRRVVFAPGLILSALFDPRARAQLNEWRDGQVIPVANRELLLSYLRVLRRVGVEEEQLRQWTLWFTEKAVYLPDLITNVEDFGEICRIVAEAGGAEVVRPEGQYEPFRVVGAA